MLIKKQQQKKQNWETKDFRDLWESFNSVINSNAKDDNIYASK